MIRPPQSWSKNTLNFGDELTVSWEVADPEVKAVYVMLHRLGHNDYYLSDRLPVDASRKGVPYLDGSRTHAQHR